MSLSKEWREQTIVIVVGPTASGKTALSLRLAHLLDGEVVGADAYQVYRYMDIGTAKPTAEERRDVPHHLLDVADPDAIFDAFRYVDLADEAIASIMDRGKVPIVAGGTGLYVRSLLRGLADMPGRNETLRAAFVEEARTFGPEQLHRKLVQIDPDYAARVGERDLVRIVRALEVHAETGRTISEVHREHASAPDRYQALLLGIDPGREVLRERIEARTDAMFRAGFVDEVRGLLEAGYGAQLPSMRALGYQQVHRHLAGEIDEPEARELTVRDTVRYAKRQRTWFRSEDAVEWIDPTTYDIETQMKSILRREAPR